MRPVFSPSTLVAMPITRMLVCLPTSKTPSGAGTPPDNTYNVVVVACDVALDADACPDSR